MKNWFEIYRGLALLLNEFYIKHKSNSGKELYKLCFSDSEFRFKNKWIEKFKPIFDVQSLDPIHIFSCFNNNNLQDERRKDKINTILRLLNSNPVKDQINFEGCPSPFVIHMLGARDENAQKEVWHSFEQIMSKGQNGLAQEVFKKLSKWYGIEISSFTIFLFWIDSENFLPLDSNTIGFLLTTRKIDLKPKNYLQYKQLLSQQNTNLYREIALLAYLMIKEEQQLSDFSQELQNYLGNQSPKQVREIDFKIVAIRLLEGTIKKYKKVLHDNQLYKFYNSFEFLEEGLIKYNSTNDIKLYRVNNLNINISAIVGRNGSGKSTLSELFFILLNNLASHFLKPKGIIPIEGVNLEFFIKTESLYKIAIELNGQVKIYRYELEGFTFSNPELVKKNFRLEQLFYAVAINYSHYALNSRYLPWVESLFQKNDGYQIPIAINPMRIDGNVNVNTEDYLVKSRLLSNILEPVDEIIEEDLIEYNAKMKDGFSNLKENTMLKNPPVSEGPKNLRYLTDDRQAKNILLSIDKAKFKFLYEKFRFSIIKKDEQKILDKVYEIFSVTNIKHPLLSYISKYILKKLIKISLVYPHYAGYFNLKTKRFFSRKIDEYLKRLKDDQSHITYKLKQTINFLKYRHIEFTSKKFKFSVEALSDNIRKVKRDNPLEKLRTVELIPPPFFTIDITLSDDSDFQDLSSGEKQRIYTISSLVYHLSNLNSVPKKGRLINYNYVSILFDEIELYYHPEMQRTFIHYLLGYLQKVNLDIQGLNFCFITHSPLILSDIPNSNILFLTKNGKPKEDPESINTFGANIHELLSESFFLENGFIGEFAKQKIQDVIDNLQPEEIPKETNILLKDSIFQIINLIGEPFLKEKLLDMYYSKYSKDELILKKERRIEELEDELKMLRNEQY